MNRSWGSSRPRRSLLASGANHWAGRTKAAIAFRSTRNAPSPWGRFIPRLAFLLSAIVLSGSAFAQGPNRGPSAFDPDWSVPAAKHLLNAANHVRGKQWAEAVQIYQKVIEQFGNRVAVLPADESGVAPAGEFVLYVDDRWYCHQAIAKLPPEARAIYRKRVDAVAERWFRQGQKERDLSLLRRVVDQAFCSSWGDDALELLGDLAFQDGRFGEARAAYGRIVADRPGDPATLVHPDPSVDLARVAAKKLLCRAASGDDPPGLADLSELRTRYPGSSGELAGRPAPMSTSSAQRLNLDQLGPSREPDNRWPTFGGSFQPPESFPSRSTSARCSGESISKRSRSLRCRHSTPRGRHGRRTGQHRA